MPVKIARSAPRPSFGLPELLVAIHTSRQSCCKAGKGRIFALVCESSGESRFTTFDASAPVPLFKKRALGHPGLSLDRKLAGIAPTE